MNFKLSSSVFITIFFLAVSCAPTKTFVRTTTDNETFISKTEHVGIINDVCLELDPLFKKDYVLLDDSKVAASYMVNEAKSYLEKKGYTVDYSLSPFVGSFLPHDDIYRLADEKGGEIRVVNPPFYFDDADSIEDAYLNAMMHILNEVYYTMSNNYNPVFTSEPALKESLNVIANYTGEDKIMFIIGNGKVVPVGKTLLQGVTLGVLTALVTFGTITYYFYDVSNFNTYVMLLDLHTGEMLWSNSMNIMDNDPRTAAYYEKCWSKNLLYYYPVREGVVLEK